MAETWRLLDTGLDSAAHNIAMNRALLEARRKQEIASTLRFLRCTPAVLLGQSQSAQQELDLAHCRSRGITVQRRVTGGRSFYIDETQLGWELYLHRKELGTGGDNVHVLQRVCHAAATALSAIGVDARYRRPDEIEIDGLTVCAAGCAVDGDAVLVQAVLWLDIDASEVRRLFRGPTPTAVHDTPRCVGMKSAMGRTPAVHRIKENLVEAFESEFDVEFSEGEAGLTEQRRFEEALDAIDTPQWTELFARPAADKPILEAVHRTKGLALGVAVACEPASAAVREVWFSGGFTINPARTVRDLEAALRDVPMARAPEKIRWFFASRPADLGTLSPEDFVDAFRLAVKQPLVPG